MRDEMGSKAKKKIIIRTVFGFKSKPNAASCEVRPPLLVLLFPSFAATLNELNKI